MLYSYERTTIRKLQRWAEELDNSIDFADYWHNFMLSETKARIDDFDDNINAFWVNRWIEDFEEFQDKYQPQPGEGYKSYEREDVVRIVQDLQFVMQVSSKDLAEHYGSDLIKYIIERLPDYESYRDDDVIKNIVENLGIPYGAKPDYEILFNRVMH